MPTIDQLRCSAITASAAAYCWACESPTTATVRSEVSGSGAGTVQTSRSAPCSDGPQSQLVRW